MELRTYSYVYRASMNESDSIFLAFQNYFVLCFIERGVCTCTQSYQHIYILNVIEVVIYAYPL